MIDLLIQSNSVDLPETGISILFQRQRTDYTNPTIVKNSFTKTIKLPGTKTNNFIFDDLWKLDKYNNLHTEFNPSKRVPFILLKDGNLIEQGYVKLNNIVWDGHFYTYEITLYGELGNLLYGLFYSVDDETEEVRPITLANLNFGFNAFAINKELIEDGWKRLNGDTSVSEFFDTINFMVSYDGTPSANNFDAKSVWCSVDRNAAVYWRDNYYYANNFPSSVVDGNITYTYINTMISRMDPEDHYGLLELKNEVSPLEMRDLRSYLLRPVVNIEKIFNAIGEYIDEHYGYTLDMSDPFFTSSEFKNTWMTLSMLYELNPDVETGTVFTKEQLFTNTSSPASYLISYCKTYGIYMDVDYYAKKLILTRLPNFFDSTKISDLKVDVSREIKINPLSFDKASYTFDYGDGDGEWLKKYKDTYGIQYGSKKVNTGYRFEASTSSYIDNNIFREGVDSIDQSIYYRYPYALRDTFGTPVLFTYPTALMDESNPPSYKLFNITSLGELQTIDGDMTPHWYPGIDTGSSIYAYAIQNSGYQFQNVWWAGLRPGVWQDGFPKLQCHSEDNKSVDGKNILVKFTGFRQTSYGHITTTEDRTYWNREVYSDSMIDATRVNYLLSDDNTYLKGLIGVNCYYDNPTPGEGYGWNYIKVINSLPQFTRSTYSYDRDGANIPVFMVAQYNTYTIGTTSSASVSSTASSFTTTISQSTGRQYPYFSTGALDANHRYFIAAAVKTSSASTIKTGNDYAHPDIIGGTLIDSNDLEYSSTTQLIGSIVQLGDTIPTMITPLSTYNVGSSVSFTTYYLVAYDLTELGMEDTITTVDSAIRYFGMTPTTVGYAYHLLDTLDFGISRVLYVPATTYESGVGVYDEYWSDYISDVYDINTKVVECYCILPNFDKVFREFYYYDNCLWILSKITDWNMETRMCKGTFIKVNHIDNYTNS